MSTFAYTAVGPNGSGAANIIDAVSLNNNFAGIVAAGNSITAANIGTLGLYPSNLIATTSAQGALGGTQPITFPASIIIAGTLAGATSINASGTLIAGTSVVGSNAIFSGTISAATSAGAAQGFVPPVFTSSGAATSPPVHIVQGSVTAVAAAVSVNLAGAAIFASATSYYVAAYDLTGGAPVTSWGAITASQFIFNATSAHVYTYFAIGP